MEYIFIIIIIEVLHSRTFGHQSYPHSSDTIYANELHLGASPAPRSRYRRVNGHAAAALVRTHPTDRRCVYIMSDLIIIMMMTMMII